MKIQRTIPPTAAPISLQRLVHGFAGLFAPRTYVARLEEELRSYFGVKHVFLVSSGKAALTLILRGLKTLQPGKKNVLIPAYTCFSVPSAVVKAGLEVSLCDITSTTYGMDTAQVKDAIDANTLCVVQNHLFGIPSEVEKIRDSGSGSNIVVVEDAAQAMGNTYQGRKLGTLGDVGFFSLGRGKNITCGSGGIIITNDAAIAAAIEQEYRVLEQPRFMETVREFAKACVLSIFLRPMLFWFPASLPFLRLGETIFYKDFPIKRLSGMNAGMMRNWQRSLEESNDVRGRNAQHFREMLGLGAEIGQTQGPAYLRLPILTQTRADRDAIISQNENKRMGISKMYPTPIANIPEIQDTLTGNATFPVAQMAAERFFTVPTHSLLSEKDQERICHILTLMAVSGKLSVKDNAARIETQPHHISP